MKTDDIIAICPVCGKKLESTHSTKKRIYWDCFDCDVQIIARDRKRLSFQVSLKDPSK